MVVTSQNFQPPPANSTSQQTSPQYPVAVQTSTNAPSAPPVENTNLPYGMNTSNINNSLPYPTHQNMPTSSSLPYPVNDNPSFPMPPSQITNNDSPPSYYEIKNEIKQ